MRTDTKIILFLTIFVPYTSYAMQNSKEEIQSRSMNINSGGSVNLKFYNYFTPTGNKIHGSINQNNNQATHQSTEQQQDTQQQQQQNQEQQQQQQQQQTQMQKINIFASPSLPKERLDQLIDWIYGSIAQHKMLIVGTGLAYGYGKLFKKVAGLNRYLRHPDRWAHWHGELTYKQLTSLEEKDLVRQLVVAIQQKYVAFDDPLSVETPLQSFLKKINYEQKQFIAYQELYSWLSTVWGQYLFPFDRKLFSKIPSKLKRIAHLKKTFCAWIAEYKIQQANLLMRSAMGIDDENDQLFGLPIVRAVERQASILSKRNTERDAQTR